MTYSSAGCSGLEEAPAGAAGVGFGQNGVDHRCGVLEDEEEPRAAGAGVARGQRAGGHVESDE